MMTQRERLFAFLRNEPTDRVPMWMLFPYHKVGYYVDVHTLPAYRKVTEYALETAIWLDRRGMGAPLFAPEVSDTWDEITRDGERIQRRVLRYNGMELCQERYLDSGRKTKKLLSSEEDLEILVQFPINSDPVAIAASLAPQAETYRREATEFPARLGSMMNSTGEPIGALHGMADIEELSIWSLTAPDLVVRILDRFQEHYRLLYRYYLEQELGPVYFMVGSELTAPPLVSVETFKRWIVPYAQELIAMIHDHGQYVIQHFHGQIHDLMPDFLTMGPDALHTIEAPPTGNCTFTQAFDIVGDRMGLIGNIQYDEFQRLTPDRMREEVRKVIDECRGKRLMLSPSAGPYEADPPALFFENYLAFMQEGWEYGKL